ncbi:uncharacterized protein L969DRAFT_88946 [Mixia osmundae IAM 14324]|uniref:Uncharacterized protein n=1 Tax=Mixia osmundae (strain CBS 9802 / IAM 14324 / JCM 22182 / KY 12970) TaxID=764103 RepID=G7E7T4_MIXOS|nr:uncharacterized protein L969DRAFT_88946 [Mixia osmundae IAM 14324]KEI38495.1 hypothetical protein L969DRAFT_88946 [Mixia osmundae IAM 14324]GAA98894.1 hypothetical protein E5Q_05582 [Mixia osmundae IAM 14324]
MSSPSYAGSLRPKRKGELVEIVEALGLDAGEHSKAELEQIIREHIKSSTDVQTSTQFSGLWDSMTESGSARSRQGRKSEVSSPPESNAADKVSAAVNGYISDAANALSGSSVEKAMADASSTVQRVAGKVVESGSTELDKALATIDTDTRQVARYYDRTAASISGVVAKYAGKVGDDAAKSAVRVQTGLSNTWILIVLGVLIEVAFFVLSSASWHKKYSFGGYNYAWLPLTPNFMFSVTLPDILVLWQFTFKRFFSLWALLTLVTPLIVSKFIVFPSPPEWLDEDGNIIPNDRLERASPVTFAVVRLAIVYYISYIAPQAPLGWNSDLIHRFAQVQMLVSSVVAALTIYGDLVEVRDEVAAAELE